MKLDAVMTPGLNGLRSDRDLEVELLLYCSRTHPDAVQLQRIQTLVQQPLDWTYLLERATYHSVLPLLAGVASPVENRQLQHLKSHTIPSTVIEQLRSNFNENFQRNLRLTSELVKLSRLFEDRSIPMLSFKGPVLAQIAYGNLALRQFLDLDILVTEADVIPASQLLVSQGFEPQFTLTDRQQTVYAGLRNEHTFWHEEKQLCVDLHWAVIPKHYSFTPDPQILWSKIDLINFGLQSVATFTPEHLLLFLCAHGAKHNWSRLYWICDIAELLRTHQDLDWETINSLAGKFGTQRMLYLGLYLAHQFLDATLPEFVLIQLKSDSKLPSLAIHIQQTLFQISATDDDSIWQSKHSIAKDVVTSLDPIDAKPIVAIASKSNLQDFIYRQTMTSLSDRMWYWIDIILTPTPLEWEIVSLPRPLFPIYYLIRLIRLTTKYLFQIAGDRD
jgi:Uncharacterised nucleotidyltransferase